MAQKFVGVDVGTGSARAGVFDQDGNCLGSAKHDIVLFEEAGNIVEQSSNDIWAAVCSSVRAAVDQAEVSPADIVGLGFDATCSLVVVKDGRPLSVGPSSDNERNIIVWMDHRAAEQAERINKSNHRVLNYVGGKVSLEMETPKLLWLKENKPEVYVEASDFFDLTDYLTWRSTGDKSRSICTVTCKWTYMAHERSWDASYFEEIGLGDLVQNGFERIGASVVDVGSSLGEGLTQQAANDLGLQPGTKVAAGLIDAHAGGVGTVGARGAVGTAETRLAYVFGTSACTMSSTTEEAFVSGVWGPYYSAMIPGLWLHEGGQSVAGAAIAHLLTMHPAHDEATELAVQHGLSLPDWLMRQAQNRNQDLSQVAASVGQLVVVPEFLGNRAPFADPDALAIISGLGFERNIESLVNLYLAGVSGLGYGLRQIIEAQRRSGIDTDTIVISGGAGKGPLVRQILADTTGVSVAIPGSEEPVLLGSAMLGAVVSGAYDSVASAMTNMSTFSEVYEPVRGELEQLHAHKFEIFSKLQAAAKK